MGHTLGVHGIEVNLVPQVWDDARADPREALMSEKERTDRERVPVGDVIAGDWILTHDEDQHDPVQLFWRSGQRSPNGEFRWSFKTSGGFRYFDQGAWVYRVTSTEESRAVDVDAVDHEISLEVTHTLALEEERAAEESLIRAVFAGVAIAVPLSILIWAGLIALAVGNKDPDWGAWLGMAGAIGILSGVFFGALAGFIIKAHVLVDADRHARQMAESARAHGGDIRHGTEGSGELRDDL
jgi:hypothetical protein